MAKNRKTKSLLFRNKKVVANSKELRDLLLKKKELLDQLKNISDLFNVATSTDQSLSVDNFSLGSLTDLSLYEDGYKGDFKIPLINLQIDLKRKFGQVNEEIASISSQIKNKEIDSLIDKSNILLSKIK